jgi:spore coat polysaccharide biosynthesis predicted glycosyltransferase SpsG
MRCMALAQAWRDLGRTVAFLSWELPNSLAVRLDAEGFHLFGLNDRPGSTNDAAQATELAHQIGAKWIVVDGYQFGSGYQEAIRSDGVHQLFVDDNGHAGSYSADVVLNQNAHAHDGFYWNRCPQTSLLLGPRYALLRNEFWRWRGWQRETAPVATNILVTMGGADSRFAEHYIRDLAGLG